MIKLFSFYLIIYIYLYVISFNTAHKIIQIMTNLNKLYALYDVRSQKERDTLSDLLTNHLPKEYTSLVIQKLKRQGIYTDSQSVRNIKGGISKNILVFNAIVEIANEYKTVSNRLKDNLRKE
ncbi:hypothetical protein GCM10022395_36400 [Snuella lapsa]|uniref:Uncharacterized protein n=2 Tax=Snuella lapsa TaxID=870481 RepID=A0ABP6YJU6_9FLAO